ncbi:polysaccharide pyruvyl transferase CsaB [[Eubacterium] tenue]|nr:polysaccharide pyruvyl transferase CsaB [[Eubacterium] tenue]MBC8630931.1 polysaccharide pyruvyl transferase CsaB [[Eubacterium] tenue]
MRVLISGYYGFNNAGDEAILKSIIIALREVNPTIDIVVLSNDIEHTKKTYNVDAINRWNIFNIYNELRKSDGLISGGGSLLQDVTSSRPVIYYTTIMRLAKLAKKPTFIYAQGVGPINKERSKKIINKVLNNVEYITLRDNESLKLLNEIGIDKPISIVPDPVMGLSIADFNKNKSRQDKESVTISVRDWDKCDEVFLEKIAIVCDKIVELNKKVIFVPMHGEHDYKTSKKVVDMMEQDADIIDHDLDIEEKISYIKDSKLMIGMRLHALIFAATVNTPMIGISYDPKIESFLKLVKQPCIGSVDGEWSPENLFKLSLDILDNNKEVKSDLNKNSNELIKLSKSTANKAIDILNKKN